MSGPYHGGGGGYPPPRSAYSPAAPNYGGPPFGSQPPARPPANLPPFPPPSYGGGAPQPPNQFRSPYDEYNPSSSSMSGRQFENNRQSFEQDVYDPYQPGAYDAGAPQMRTTSPYQTQHNSHTPPTGPPHRMQHRPGQPQHDLPLLTAPTITSIGNYNATVYTLPQSHLPITKYVPVSPGDAIDIHRAICQTGKTQAVWYAEADTRAGEGWGSAIEWVLETGMSGAKLRICVPDTDALGTELAAINKAVEGFREQLHQSVRNQKPMSHEFVLFTSSAAALVSIDTSSRPESLQFCRMWREICMDYLQAHLTLVHLPKGSEVEGFTLAERIANVAAQNSYQKRRKERLLDEVYARQGGGDSFPRGSTEAGAWQRGDADPSRRKSPFERPKPLPPVEPLPLPPLPRPPVLPPFPPPTFHTVKQEVPRSPPPRVQAPEEPEDEEIKPRGDALCVTNFPDNISAKDLGILLAQFGDIVSVDMFSVPPVKPRFAFVAYSDPSCSDIAIEALNGKPLQLDTPFAMQNAQDLEIWKGFSGVMTVVASDPNQLIPPAIAKDFPDLPSYATSRADIASGQKRTRDAAVTSADAVPADSPSPKKPRQQSPDKSEQPASAANGLNSSLPSKPAGFAALPPRPQGSYDEQVVKSKSATPPRTHNGLPASHSPHAAPAAALTAPVAAAEVSTPSPALDLPTKTLTTAPSTTSSPAVPVKLGGKTLQAQIDLVTKVFVKHDRNNWIAHTCLIATDLDQIRRQLQDQLFATDEATLQANVYQERLIAKGFTVSRIDAFVAKVLKVLDGIAAEDLPTEAAENVHADESALATTLDEALKDYPEQTREAMAAAGKVLEYLNLGKKEQEEKCLQIERRLGVLQGMSEIGEQVSKVVSFLLN